MIELDVIQQNENIHVDHDDDGDANGAFLSRVLADSALRSGDEILFIEIKETTIGESFIRDLLNMLSAYGFGIDSGRPVVLRTFHSTRDHLLQARTLLDGVFSPTAGKVLLNELFELNKVSAVSDFQDMVIDVQSDDFNMAEFHYQNDNLYALISLARSMGLGVNLWTIPSAFGEVFVAALRDEVDVLTVDHDIAAARQIVQDNNGLV